MIECGPTVQLGSSDYMALFKGRAIRERVPLAGAFDITYRCNQRCVHCYCGHLVAQSPAQARELGTSDVLRMLAEAADAGCLHMLLSGGEPFLRSDFSEIYQGACQLGLVTTVFTNATLVDERVLAVFREYPPRLVEISVYGATEETYERITGVAGSFARASHGIQALSDAGVKIGLKTMILRDNLHQVREIEAMAEEMGVTFRLDPLVTPRLDGARQPLAQRVDPVAGAALELATEKRRLDAVAFRERQEEIPDVPRLYRCGAGVTNFHLDPQGVLRPCLMSQEFEVDATEVGFGAAWRSVVETMDGLTRKEDSQCAKCNWKAVCGYCPGAFALETGSPDRHSAYMCGLAEARLGMIEDTCEARRP